MDIQQRNLVVVLKKDGYDKNEIQSKIGNLQLLIAYCLYCEGIMENALKYYSKLKENKSINSIYQQLIKMV